MLKERIPQISLNYPNNITGFYSGFKIAIQSISKKTLMYPTKGDSQNEMCQERGSWPILMCVVVGRVLFCYESHVIMV